MRGVLDHLQPVSLRDLVDRRQVARETGEVNRDDGLRTRRDRFLDLGRVNIEGCWVDVHQDWLSPPVNRTHCRRGEGVVRGDHLVPGLDAMCREGDLEPGRRRRDRNRLNTLAKEFNKIPLELGRTAARCKPS